MGEMDYADALSVFYFSRRRNKTAVERRVLIISNSSIGMESARTYTSVRTDVKQFKAVLISQTNMVSRLEADALSRIKEQCINYLLRWLFGLDDEKLNKYIIEKGGGGMSQNMMKVTYTEEYSFSESEQTDFSAAGKVVCADGREIDFSLEIGMSRSFESSYAVSFEKLEAIDPLVINLDCNVADVSVAKDPALRVRALDKLGDLAVTEAFSLISMVEVACEAEIMATPMPTAVSRLAPQISSPAFDTSQ